MSKQDTVHTITSLTNEHPTATLIGKIIGRVAIPVGLVAGAVYVTRNM